MPATKTKGTRWTRTLRRRLDAALTTIAALREENEELARQVVRAPPDDAVQFAAWVAASVAVLWTPEMVAEVVSVVDRPYVLHHHTWNIFEVRDGDLERCLIPIRDALTRPVAQAIHDAEGGARTADAQWAAAQARIAHAMLLQ
jgi:hypothetical protein